MSQSCRMATMRPRIGIWHHGVGCQMGSLWACASQTVPQRPEMSCSRQFQDGRALKLSVLRGLNRVLRPAKDRHRKDSEVSTSNGS
jgi:hypothetical protein